MSPAPLSENLLSLISCGGTLSHLLIAIRHFGYAYELELFPDSNNEDLLSRIIVDDRKEPNIEENSFFEAITKRRTNRLEFEDRELDESLISRLKSVVTTDKDVAEGGGTGVSVWLYITKEEDKKNSLADLITQGDRTQLSDKRFRRELASWIHSNRSHSKDGIPGYAFGYNDIMSHMGPFVLRTFDSGNGQAAKDRELAAGSPALAILGTRSDEPMDWLKTGMALSRMLLAAQTENVWSSFLNQPHGLWKRRKTHTEKASRGCTTINVDMILFSRVYKIASGTVPIMPKVSTLVLSFLVTPGTNPEIEGSDSSQSVYPINSEPFGLTYGEWTAKWWQSPSSIPTNDNPLVDENGGDTISIQVLSS